MLAEKDKTVLDLLDKIKAGDSCAFDRIVELYQTPLFGYLKVRIYCGRKEELEDLSQIIWLNIFEKVNLPFEQGGYSPQAGSFYTYLTRRIAEYKVRQWFDEKKKVNERVAFGDDHALEKIPAGDTPETTYEFDENMRLRENAYREFFRLLFLCGGYPHQQLAFGFTKLLHGTQSTRTLEGKIMNFYSMVKTQPLSELIDEFRTEYSSESFFEGEKLEELYGFLQPVEARLELTVKQIMGLDAASLDYNVDIAEKVMRDTNLKEYCEKPGKEKSGKEISDGISNWCYRLKIRLKRMLSADSAEDLAGEKVDVDKRVCNHCYLRNIPPCGETSKSASD